LSFHLRPGLPNGLFPSDFPTKSVYAIVISPVRTTCPAHLILLDFVTVTAFREAYPAPATSAHPLVQIFSACCSPPSSVCVSLSLRDQISQPYNTTVGAGIAQWYSAGLQAR
jgi:hypothetical protein